MPKVIRYCKKCNREFSIYISATTRNRGQYCSKKCAGFGGNTTSGSNNCRWNGGKTFHDLGYILLKRPNHPHADRHGYVREHRLVMEKHLGRYLEPKEEIHHLNGKVDDNRIENLELIASRSEHLKLEHKLGTYKLHLIKLNTGGYHG